MSETNILYTIKRGVYTLPGQTEVGSVDARMIISRIPANDHGPSLAMQVFGPTLNTV